MSTPIFTVIRPGLMTTIQDHGREGMRGMGIGVGGAMDTRSMRAANALVGNAAGDAVLEMTLLGPTLRADAAIVAAITGADVQPSIDGARIDTGSVFEMRPGQTLTFGKPVDAVRAYLAIAGGFDVPVVLGSRATFLRAGFGGMGGRPLRIGDTLLGRAAGPSDVSRLGWRDLQRDGWSGTRQIRIIEGPHHDCFSADAFATFCAAEYTVSHESDRMGIRLAGPPVDVIAQAGMVSEPVPLGAVQAPPSGSPIVLMVDHQTTGGYPLIAVVISADIHLLSQCTAGSPVKFVPVSLDEAHQAWRELQRDLATIETGARLRT